MIYQLVNMRTETLAIVTSHKAHLCYYCKHVFVPLISMPRFNSNNFYQNWLKIKLFLPKKYKIFEDWGLRPQTPGTTPSCCRFLAAHLHTPICREKIGLKLELRNCGKTKLFLI